MATADEGSARKTKGAGQRCVSDEHDRLLSNETAREPSCAPEVSAGGETRQGQRRTMRPRLLQRANGGGGDGRW